MPANPSFKRTGWCLGVEPLCMALVLQTKAFLCAGMDVHEGARKVRDLRCVNMQAAVRGAADGAAREQRHQMKTQMAVVFVPATTLYVHH